MNTSDEITGADRDAAVSLGGVEGRDLVASHLASGLLVEAGSRVVATDVQLTDATNGVANTSIRESRSAAVAVISTEFGATTLHYQVTAMLGVDGWRVMSVATGGGN